MMPTVTRRGRGAVEPLLLALLLFAAPTGTAVAGDDIPRPYNRGHLRTLGQALRGWAERGGRYERGNWTGPGWWGGSRDPDRPGDQPPVDSMDAIAMRHDMGYWIAEEYGRAFGSEAIEQRLKAMSDALAVRAARVLPDDPRLWPEPPGGRQGLSGEALERETRQASDSRAQIISGFTLLSPLRRVYGAAADLSEIIEYARIVYQDLLFPPLLLIRTRELSTLMEKTAQMMARFQTGDPGWNLTYADLDRMISQRVREWDERHRPAPSPLVRPRVAEPPTPRVEPPAPAPPQRERRWTGHQRHLNRP